MSEPSNNRYDPSKRAKGAFRAGGYKMDLLPDDDTKPDKRVESEQDIDGAYEAPEKVRFVLHRQDRCFVRLDPTTIDGARATVTLSAGEVELTDVGLVGAPEQGLYIATIAEAALEQELNNPESRVRRVHGFRFWNHIAWFATLDGDPEPLDRPNPDCGGADDTEPIALLDTGVDTRHEWFWKTGKIVQQPFGGPPGATDHGTMVAGVLRQTAPCSTIHSLRVSTRNAHIADECKIIRALDYCIENDVKIAVMAFGAEVWPGGDDSELASAIQAFLDGGGKVFAAAGNLEGDDDSDRQDVYPAAFPRVIAVEGRNEHGVLYPWSNAGSDPSKPVTVTNTDRPDGYLYTSHSVARGKSLYAKAQGTSLLAAIAAGIEAGGKMPFPERV